MTRQGDVPAWQGDMGQGVLLTITNAPLGWMLEAMVTPVVEVDRWPIRARWGTTMIPLPAGEHSLHVHIPYAIPSRIGPVDTVVTVEPGRVTRLEYAVPMWVFSRGSLGAPPQAHAGLWVLIAILTTPLAAGALYVLISLYSIMSMPTM